MYQPFFKNAPLSQVEPLLPAGFHSLDRVTYYPGMILYPASVFSYNFFRRIIPFLMLFFFFLFSKERCLGLVAKL